MGTPSIGAALLITNPLSSGYLAYLAAADAYLSFVDELVVVDGGSTDDSIRELARWTAEDSRVRVVSDAQTHWGTADRWHLGQFAVNMNRALAELQSDWAFVFSSDYVLDEGTLSNLVSELSRLDDAIWVDTWRGKPRQNALAHRVDRRNMVFNLRRIRRDGLLVGFGCDQSTGMTSDWPIVFEAVAEFADPDSGARKLLYMGPSIPCGGSLSCEFVAYGHFTYNLRQVDTKIVRWERGVSRFTGLAPARLAELRRRHGVRVNGTPVALEEVLGWGHPGAMRRLLSERYYEGMQGGLVLEASRLWRFDESVLSAGLRSERRLRTLARRVVCRSSESARLEWRSARL